MDQSLVLWLLSAVCIITGLSGRLLPLLPDEPELLLGLLFGAWADNFQYVGIWSLLVLAGMAGLTYLVEFAASILGVKKFGGEVIKAGGIIVRQRGTQYHQGSNVGMGVDHTLFALIDGVVKFEHKSKSRYKVSVYPRPEVAAS